MKLRVLVALALSAAPLAAQDGPVVLRAARVLDGRGGAAANRDILVQDGRIVSIAPRGRVPVGARLVDLGNRTVMPGLIDVHAHPAWYFNRQGRLHQNSDGDTPAQSILAAASNAYATLMAGFTTIQSVGDRRDAD
ncbi:MAG: amidohydrolase family protein, partial [Gemmatimonadales bacterium]